MFIIKLCFDILCLRPIGGFLFQNGNKKKGFIIQRDGCCPNTCSFYPRRWCIEANLEQALEGKAVVRREGVDPDEKTCTIVQTDSKDPYDSWPPFRMWLLDNTQHEINLSAIQAWHAIYTIERTLTFQPYNFSTRLELDLDEHYKDLKAKIDCIFYDHNLPTTVNTDASEMDLVELICKSANLELNLALT